MSDHDSFDDDDELELEPVDPEILAHEKARAKRQSRAAEDSVDVNEVYNEVEIGDPVNLDQLKGFRFTTRHMLIVTALLAIAMTLYVRLGGCMAIFVSGCTALGAGWWFVLREEKQRLAEAEARRQEFAQWLAAKRAKEDGEEAPQLDQAQLKKMNAQWEAEEEITRPSFKFSFSMKEILSVFVIAAVALTLVRWMGGTQNAAMLLGFVALAGLVVQALGIELPPLLLFGWWLLLVLYILISLLAVVRAGEEVAMLGLCLENYWLL